MTLKKLTIDNSVKYVSNDSNSQSDFKPKTVSLPKKQNKKHSQNKLIKNVVGERFRMIKRTTNCYF